MDETTPLLPSTTNEILEDDRRILDHALKDVDVVDFDPNGDPENPQDWANSYKWGIVALLATQAFAVTFTCISVVPVAQTIVDDLLRSSEPGTRQQKGPDDTAASSAAVLLVTIWELGEALGALFIAPLSELYGRAPVMNIGNLLFVACTAAGALSRSVSLLIAARALTGVAVVTNVLNPAIIGDIFPPEQRGAAMSLVQLSPLLGGAIGPAIAGAVSQGLGWRANLWMSTVLAGACEVVFLVLFRETYKVPILRRKAARLRRETGNGALRTEFDLVQAKHDGHSNWKLMAEAVLRPFVVLKSSFVLQIVSLYSGILFSYFYTMSTSFPRLLQDLYGFTPAETGLSFITFSKFPPLSPQIYIRVLVYRLGWADGTKNNQVRAPSSASVSATSSSTASTSACATSTAASAGPSTASRSSWWAPASSPRPSCSTAGRPSWGCRRRCSWRRSYSWALFCCRGSCR